MMRKATGALAAAFLAALGAARSALALEVGDRAPEFDVAEWVQGEPAKLADGGGKTWLVVLWGTFEADCVDAMPELNALYEKQKEKGLEIAAISTEPADTLRTFLSNHRLTYRVASDPAGKTTRAYAAGIKTLPMSWLVDKAGIVVWRGGLPEAPRIVEEVFAGRFDMKRAKELQERQSQLWKALFSNDWEALSTLSEKILETEPGDSFAMSMRILAFRVKNDGPGFKAFMKRHIERAKDDATVLANAARELGSDNDYSWRDLPAAMDAAKRAVEISKSADANVLSTYAHLLFLTGLTEQAVEQQKKAVAVDKENDSRKQVLGYYEACVAARKKAAPSPKKK